MVTSDQQQRAQMLARRYAELSAVELTSAKQAGQVESELAVTDKALTRLVGHGDWSVDRDGRLHA